MTSVDQRAALSFNGNAPTQPSGSPIRPDPDKWVESYADALYRHAVLRLRDRQVAEDLVQETFLAAWKGRSEYRGASSEKTWLFAILKNKIMDYYRKLSREISFTDLQSLSKIEDSAFQSEGFHRHAWTELERPRPWLNARESLSQGEFWIVLQDCLSKLPRHIARAFLMREVDAVASREVCQTLNVTSGNLWVMLHRARLALRRCLEKNWFDDGPPSSPPPASK